MTPSGPRFADYFRFIKVGLLLLLFMGITRFVVGVLGVPYERATHLTSLTILVFLLAVVYGQRASARRFGTYRHLIPLACLLSATMYGFIVLAIAFEGWTGLRGYFHAPGSGFAPHEIGIGDHILGQLSVMWIMAGAILGTMFLGYALSRHLAHLRNAFALLVGVALARFALGPLGVPEAAGRVLMSLTAYGVLFSIYESYRAPLSLARYRHALLLALAIAFVTFHLAVYGFIVSDALGIETYYTTGNPSTSVAEYVYASLYEAPIAAALMTLGAVVGVALRRRSSSFRDVSAMEARHG